MVQELLERQGFFGVLDKLHGWDKVRYSFECKKSFISSLLINIAVHMRCLHYCIDEANKGSYSIIQM